MAKATESTVEFRRFARPLPSPRFEAAMTADLLAATPPTLAVEDPDFLKNMRNQGLHAYRNLPEDLGLLLSDTPLSAKGLGGIAMLGHLTKARHDGEVREVRRAASEIVACLRSVAPVCARTPARARRPSKSGDLRSNPDSRRKEVGRNRQLRRLWGTEKPPASTSKLSPSHRRHGRGR